MKQQEYIASSTRFLGWSDGNLPMDASLIMVFQNGTYLEFGAGAFSFSTNMVIIAEEQHFNGADYKIQVIG